MNLYGKGTRVCMLWDTDVMTQLCALKHHYYFNNCKVIELVILTLHLLCTFYAVLYAANLHFLA